VRKEIAVIAYCGLDCEKCDAFVATAKNDDALRAATAEKWAKAFNAPLTAPDINCTGCRSAGVKFGYCERMCEIRKCASGKGFATCADCPDFSCKTLEGVLTQAPQAREALEKLRGK
jgi:hypothetical protein